MAAAPSLTTRRGGTVCRGSGTGLTSGMGLQIHGCAHTAQLGRGDNVPTRMPIRAVALSLVVVAVAAAPAHAASLGRAGDGTFGRPFAVTPPGTKVDDGGAAAVSPGGRVVAAWT